MKGIVSCSRSAHAPQVPVYDDVPVPPPYISPSSTFNINPRLSPAFSFNSEKDSEAHLPPGRYRSSVLLKIGKVRLYVGIIALLVAIPSFVLILVGLVTYEKTKASHLAEVVNPTTGKEIYVEITTKPNITFAAIGGVNTLLSGLLLLICWKSSKISYANNVVNAVVYIIGFMGFASTMRACVYLQQNNQLRTTLWEWACDNQSHSGPGLRNHEICRVIDASWVLALFQAAFDLLTVLLTVILFSLWKWRLFSRHGRLGRIF